MNKMRIEIKLTNKEDISRSFGRNIVLNQDFLNDISNLEGERIVRETLRTWGNYLIAQSKWDGDLIKAVYELGILNNESNTTVSNTVNCLVV